MAPDLTGESGLRRKYLARAALITALWVALVSFLFLWAGQWPGPEAWQPLLSAEMVKAACLFTLFFVLSLVIRALRWYFLLRVSVSVGCGQVLAVYGWIFLLKSLTPYRAGDALRALWVRRVGGEFSFGLSNLVFERMLDIFCLAALGVTTLLGLMVVREGHWSLAIGMGTVLVVLVAVFSCLSFLEKGVRRLRAWAGGTGKAWWSRLVTSLLEFTERVLVGLRSVSEPRLRAISAGLTLMTWLVLSCGYWIVLATVFPHLGWAAATFLIVMVNLIGVLGGTPGNVGSYEFAGVVALGIFGVDASVGLPVVAALHVMVLSATLLFGLLSRLLLQRYVARTWDIY